ncbi:hypothetical protein SANTM175S_07513 [Streptomyces antimycoticus]
MTLRRPRRCSSAMRGAQAHRVRSPPPGPGCAGCPSPRIRRPWAAGGQPSLFEPGPPPLPPGADPLEALLAVYAEQLVRTEAAEHPDRMPAADHRRVRGDADRRRDAGRAGVPWSADRHRELLDELLGERYPGGLEPQRLVELADEVSRAFGTRVAARSARRGRQGVRPRGHRARLDPRLGARADRSPRRGATAALQEALPAAHRPRLGLAPVLGARGPLPPGVPARRHRLRPLDDERRRGAADPQGGAARGGGRPGVAAGGGRRRPDGAPGARRDLPRPRADGGRAAAAGICTRRCPTAPSPATASWPSWRCWARCTARPPATA